ncbi:unnamed protein product, partial [Ixodes pacificus]
MNTQSDLTSMLNVKGRLSMWRSLVRYSRRTLRRRKMNSVSQPIGFSSSSNCNVIN